MRPTVPFKENLYPPNHPKGTSKNDMVLAVKRAVSRYGTWPWQEFDDVYSLQFSHGTDGAKSPKTKSGVAGFQRVKGLDPTGNYGKATHDALVNSRVPENMPHGGEWVFDQGAISLYNGFNDLSDAERIVIDYYKWWDWLVAREPSWHYSMDRPMQPLSAHEDPPSLPSWADCSSTFIYCGFLADAKPQDSQYRYTGYGATSTLINHGISIRESEVPQYCKTHIIGAFYGPSIYNTKHMVAVKSPTEVYSHGKESGPNKYSSIHYGHPYPVVSIRAYPVI